MNYDQLIIDNVAKSFPQLLQNLGEDAWKYIKAQVWAESKFKPDALSPRGAQGLMQMMPATAKEWGVQHPFDPEDNIKGGIKYMADLYRQITSIPHPLERLKFAFACYNGGPGYTWKALELGRSACGMPAVYSEWVKERTPGQWQMWEFTSRFYADPLCVVHGRRPDAGQITGYVAKICAKRAEY